jgi:DEAD/DEAH box helicase domain-containing protein
VKKGAGYRVRKKAALWFACSVKSMANSVLVASQSRLMIGYSVAWLLEHPSPWERLSQRYWNFVPRIRFSPGPNLSAVAKLISFTDSRQGTARTAAKLQQDSERNRVRALVYHHLLAAQGSGSLSDDDEQDLADLMRERSQGPLSPRDEKLLNKLLADKAALQQPELSWRELQQRLAAERDVKEGLLDYYSRLFPGVFERNVSSGELARMFLFREFARRPKRVNSLESMGLVQLCYPQIESTGKKPVEWPGDMASWRNYLKVLLDFYVRENTFIQIDDNLLNVIGNRFSPQMVGAANSARKGG